MYKILLLALAFVFNSGMAREGQQHKAGQLKQEVVLSNIDQSRFPKSVGYVNDYVYLLDSTERVHLAQKLTDFEAATTNQMAIVIIDSDTLTIANFDAFALALSNSWDVGGKGKNNGLTIVLSPKLRKIRINTGAGIEHILTDQICGNIIRTIIVPEFKQENYFRGLDKATDELIRLWRQ